MGKKNKKIKEKDFPIEVKEEKEEKKESKVAKNFNMYKFIIKLIAFAILVVFGIMILIFKDNSTGAIYMVTGLVAGFSAIFRLIPLMKTLKTHRGRLVSLIEIIADLVVGVYLVIAAFVLWGQVNSENFQTNGYNWFNDFNFKAYKYILIALLGSRSIIYYYQVIICEEASTKINFYLHTAINIIAIVLACIPFEAKDVPVVLAVLAFISAAVVGGEAGGGYYNYRKTITKKEKPADEKQKEEGIEAPGEDEDKIISDIDPNIVPEKDHDQDSVVM